MLISTRGRYALRVMIDLAEHGNDSYVAMREVAEREQVSLKYLERILPLLVKEDLIEGVHGKGGGYRLTRDPADYKLGEILRLTEGDLAPVSCLEQGAEACERKNVCKTLPVWAELNRRINEYLDSVTLLDLVNN
ncbi:MAG: Rrf2 family transcriptional regulator [Lachnospiraceae bacterium]|nr:Rrf2 family transcriptional regulator [Lachnospiraceae bacterium]